MRDPEVGPPSSGVKGRLSAGERVLSATGVGVNEEQKQQLAKISFMV